MLCQNFSNNQFEKPIIVKLANSSLKTGEGNWAEFTFAKTFGNVTRDIEIIGTAYRLASHAGDEIRAPLKTPAWEATYRRVPSDDPRDNWVTRFGSVSSVVV